jgi:hypothetical protein
MLEAVGIGMGLSVLVIASLFSLLVVLVSVWLLSRED